MEKIILIDGKEVPFKSNGAIPFRYKQQFGKDFFAEIAKMSAGNKEFTMENVDLEVFYNLAWVFAKTADKTIPAPMEWLESFDVFPIFDIMPEIQDMLLATMQTKKK